MKWELDVSIGKNIILFKFLIKPKLKFTLNLNFLNLYLDISKSKFYQFQRSVFLNSHMQKRKKKKKLRLMLNIVVGISKKENLDFTLLFKKFGCSLSLKLINCLKGRQLILLDVFKKKLQV